MENKIQKTKPWNQIATDHREFVKKSTANQPAGKEEGAMRSLTNEAEAILNYTMKRTRRNEKSVS